MGTASSLALAARFALREMRGGLRGFFVFLACIAIGVAAISGVNSVADAIRTGVAEQGRTLLGGDVRARIAQREANPAELGFLSGLGEVSESASLRSMARKADGSDQTLVELKAVDGLYPLYGTLVTQPAAPLADLLSMKGDAFGAVAPPLLFDRLGLSPGDRILLGNAAFELRARLDAEPDAASEGLALAPRLLVSLDGLKAAGLVQPGSLVQHIYKVRLPAEASAAELARIRENAARDFPESGWSLRTSDNAAPALSANVERFSQFLTLVGLTALVVGGVGVANAVSAYLDGKRGVIATLKSLGAGGRFVFALYLFQILMVAAIGILAGLVLGALLPFLANGLLSGVIPVPAQTGIYPLPLALGALFGVLVTLVFALLPLGRTRMVSAAALFRELGFEARRLPPWPYAAAAAGLAVLMAAIAIFAADDRRLSAIFVGAAVAAFLVLRLLGVAVEKLAALSPRPRWIALRLGLANIHRAGAITPSVVLSLGLGLTLAATLAMVEGNLRNGIGGVLADEAPNFFFVDIQPGEVEAFSGLVAEIAPDGVLERVPMLRGRLMALNGVETAKAEIPADGAWVVRGDRGLTYAEAPPAGATIVEGSWWAQDYSGPPLVSFSADEAHALGLGVGDEVTVNVLGRNITARIANLRRVEWQSLSINFVMIFTPNAFAGAPHAWLATLRLPDRAAPAEEPRILKAVTTAFPAVTTVRVKDALDTVNDLIGQISTAIRAAASIALIASVLVLAGALAAGSHGRIHDAVVLKTLGATRRTLIAAFSFEYLLVGLATALFALAAGGIAAWFVVARIMRLPFVPLPEVAAATVALALLVTVGVGLAGTWRVLGQKAAPVLRNL